MLRKANLSKIKIINVRGTTAASSTEETLLHEPTTLLQNLTVHAICNGTLTKLVDQRSAA
jgi:hypothetical protein